MRRYVYLFDLSNFVLQGYNFQKHSSAIISDNKVNINKNDTLVFHIDEINSFVYTLFSQSCRKVGMFYVEIKHF